MLTGLKDTPSQSRNVPDLGRPVPMIISGGSAMRAEFRDRVEKFLNSERKHA
ncbi:MAG: hypothetical protein M3Z23_07820 [Acidobacteriota bacterium]|nr:hypothetical protein [Acidobacteriota bacterium]